MRPRGRAARAAFVALVLAACGGGERGGASTRFTTDRTPAIDIADSIASGTARPSDFNDAVRLSTGAVVVANDRDGTLRKFDSTGHPVAQAGRRGGGPGEFAMVKRLLRCSGDSLYAWDPMLARINVFDATLKFARTFGIPSNTWKLSCNAAGAIAAIMSPAVQLPSADAPELFTTVILFSDRGDSIARIDSVPAGRNRPMVPITDIARTPTGVLVATGDSAFVEVFSDSGRRSATLRVTGTQRALTTADYQMAIDSIYLAPMVAGAQRDRLRAALATIPMPVPPAYRQMLADRAGDPWFLVSWPGDSDVVYRGIAAGGASLGELHVPRGVTVLEIGADYALGRRVDASGTPHIQVYRFHRGT